MAETIATETITRKQGIARVELFTEAALPEADRVLRVHFEDYGVKPDGSLDLIASPPLFGTRMVERKFGDIATQTVTATDPVTGENVTVSIAGLATLIAVVCYQFRDEDVAAE